MAKKPNKAIDPERLQVLIGRFAEDYEKMEQHVTGQELDLQAQKNRIVFLREVLRRILQSHNEGTSNLDDVFAEKIKEILNRKTYL